MFPNCIAQIIAEYSDAYVLLDWVDETKLDWEILSSRPRAINLLENNKNKIVWNELSMNPGAIHLLEMNTHKINWLRLSVNHNAVYLLEMNLHRICWIDLSINHSAVYLLEMNPHKIEWDIVLPHAGCSLHLLRDNLNKIEDWYEITVEPNAISIIESNMDNVRINTLYYNTNATYLLENHIQVVGITENACKGLCNNTSLIYILESNMSDLYFHSGISWYNILNNPAAVHLVRDNIDMMPAAYINLFKNIMSIDSLKKGIKDVDWSTVSYSDNIFTSVEKAIYDILVS